MLEYFHPLLSFLLLRPLVVLLVFGGTLGWGHWLGKGKTCYQWSNGLYGTLAYIWMLSFLGWVSVWTVLPWFLVGSLGLERSGFFEKVSRSRLKGWTWVLLPFFALLFVRASAPPYFVDFLSYHLPIAIELVNSGGWTPIEHNFFMQVTSTGIPESFAGMGYLLGDEITMVMMNLGLTGVLLFQLREFFYRHDALSLWWGVALLVLTTPLITHSIIYGKTEIFLLVLALDVLLRFGEKEFPNHQCFNLGIAIGVLGMAKLSLLPLAVGFGFWGMWKVQKAPRVIWLIMGGLLPIFFWITRNLLMHDGMPFFPVLIDSSSVPSFFADGVRDKVSREMVLPLSKALGLLWNLFLGTDIKYFRPNIFFLVFTLAVGVGVIKRQWLKLGFLLLAILHWIWWIQTYSFVASTARLAFIPIFLGLVLILPSFKDVRLARGLFFCFILGGTLHYVSQEGRVLPGLRYHLNLQNRAEYYGKIPIAIVVLSEHLSQDHPDLPRVVLSELAGAVRGTDIIREHIPLNPTLKKNHLYLYDRTIEWDRCDRLEEMTKLGTARQVGSWGRAKGIIVL